MRFRQLIERPFRHYADFSGRSGRAEYWLLILLFIVLTEVAWLVGFGGMRLAGFDAYDHSARPHFIYDNRPDAPENLHNLQDLLDDGEDDDSHILFKLHRHDGEGIHLHGSVRQWRERWHKRQSPEGDHSESDQGRIVHFDHHQDDATDAEDGGEFLEMIAALAMLVPIMAAGARRLHDTGRSGWWQLFVLIPVAGWLALAIFLLIRGEPEENRFGPPAPG